MSSFDINCIHGPHGRRFILLLLTIILGLSAYTHIWNPIGFPTFQTDEGEYIAHGMHFLKGLGIQESSFYDHPYFGQVFLAAIFRLIGFPGSINPSTSDLHSIETLYAVPRILMGVLAVVDTVLIYKISECRYGRKVGFIASILFAVMPVTWLTRRIFLDSIQLPFLLSAILFADHTTNLKGTRKVSLALISGVFLGLAIFTKIPAFTMIPMVGFLIYNSFTNSNIRKQALGIWFVPVILIPLIWPIYALSVGELHLWLDGILLQLHRIKQPLVDSVNAFFKDDPILLLLGIGGIVFAALKRDYFLLLWSIPFIVFLYFIGYVSLFYFIPLLPVLCIAAAKLIVDVLDIIKNKKVQQVVLFVVISGIAFFGLVSITMLLTLNLTSSQFKVTAFIAQHLPLTTNSRTDKNKISMISDPFYSWISQYVFVKNHVYKSYDNKQPITTQKILLVVESGFIHVMLGYDKQAKRLQEMYNNTKTILASTENRPKYDFDMYPYTNLAEYPIEERIEIRTNY